MRTRGRPSVNDLTVIGAHGIETIRRPDPPSELTKEQAEEWKDIVNRMPADWFPRETHSLLIQLCRHTIECRHIGALINKLKELPEDKFSLRDYRQLLSMQDRESRSVAALTSKMRISHQASKRQSLVTKPTMYKRPWMTEDAS